MDHSASIGGIGWIIAVELLLNRFGIEVTMEQTTGAATIPWTVVEAL